MAKARETRSRYKTFEFPALYDFPPFFTLQPVEGTRETQNEAWLELILAFTRHFRVYELDVAEAAATSPLFRNDAIDRKLSEGAIRELLDLLVERGQAEWSSKAKGRVTILWRSVGEWASLIYKWADDLGKVNEVITLYNLREGEDSEGREFYQLPEPIVLRALSHLEKQNKAVVFQGENTSATGVKFFS